MSRYSPAMPRSQSIVSAVAILLLAAPVQAATPGEISQETLRSAPKGGRVLQAWWLPPEYWVASAEKQGWPEEKLADLVKRISVERNGEAVEPLRIFDPSLAQTVPQLSYFLRVSLGPLQQGMKLLFFPNLNAEGEPILLGSREGEVRVRYRPGGDAAPTEFLWRSPLTSIVGPTSCPEGGEPLEASWKFCPWHGVKLKPDPGN
jgi:hypothetical protein